MAKVSSGCLFQTKGRHLSQGLKDLTLPVLSAALKGDTSIGTTQGEMQTKPSKLTAR